GVGREVVMEQERVSDGTKQGIHHLCITGRTQCGHHDGLSFTTGEHGRTMSGRQHAGFDGQRTHGVVITTVDTRLAFDHAVTHHFILQGANHVGDFVGRETFFAFFSGQFFNGGVFDFVQTGVTGHFVRNGVSLADGSGGFCFHGAVQRFVTGFSLPVPLLDTQFGGPLADGGNGGLECRVREQYGTQHFVFGQFLSLRFHHQYGVFGTGYDHVQQRVLQLAVGRVQQVAIFFSETHTGTTDRAVERNTRHGQRGRGRDHGADIRINVFLGAHHGQQYLNFVHEAFREQRTNRTVDQTGRQGFFFGRTAFTLQVTTRYTTGSVHFFLVMHGQREEILT